MGAGRRSMSGGHLVWVNTSVAAANIETGRQQIRRQHFIDRLFRCAVARSLSKTTGRRWRQIVGINSWKTPEKTRPEMLMEGVGTDALGRWLHPTPFVPRRFTCSPWNHPLPPGLLPPPLPHHLVALSSFLFLS